MDPRIEGQYLAKAGTQIAELTLKCLETDPKNRPSMKEVLQSLEQIDALKEKLKETNRKNHKSRQPPQVPPPGKYIHHRF